jgi:DNA-binding CsgD family transcriptional regulator/PAS domain-containing protein
LNHRISDIVAKVYDAAIEPKRWHSALQLLGTTVSAKSDAISIQDPHERSINIQHRWGDDPHWTRLFEEKYAATVPFYPVLASADIDDVMTNEDLVMRLGDRSVLNGVFFKEWVEPAGYCDCMAAVLMRTGRRVATLNVFMSIEHGPVKPHELDIVRRITPHLRRAVTINNLLDMNAFRASTFDSVIDAMSIGVVLVTDTGMILHANAAAKDLVTGTKGLKDQYGKLRITQRLGQKHLDNALLLCGANEAGMGPLGIGVPATAASGRPLSLHVLPLKRRKTLSGFDSTVAAAVIIAEPGQAMTLPEETLCGLFGLTGTEARVLVQLMAGGGRAEVADRLGIAAETAKSHLGRIFEKTETSSQAELRQLVQELTPPLRALEP